MAYLPIKDAEYFLKLDSKMACHDNMEFYVTATHPV
jgi:hypothetical protein